MKDYKDRYLKGLLLAALLVLGFGALDWKFPWWLWTLAVIDSCNAYRFQR